MPPHPPARASRGPAKWAALLLPATACLVLMLQAGGKLSSSYTTGWQFTQRAVAQRAVPLAWPSRELGHERSLKELEFSSVPLSTIQCNKAKWKRRVCWVHNLYVSAGAAIFVAEDPTKPLPELRLSEFAGGHTPLHPLNHLLSVVGQQEAASLFAAAGAQQAPAPAGGPWRFRVLEAALGLQPFLLSNWWHASDDMMKATLLFCKYLGKCKYSDVASAATGVLFIETQAVEHMPGPVREAFGCFGELLRIGVNASLEHLRQPGGGGREPVALVQTAVFGVGNEIIHPYVAESCGVRRANDTMRRLQIEFERQCVGLPEESPPRAVPTLRIINREYRDGRSILGVAEIVDHLRKNKPEDLELNIEVTFPSQTNFSQQAHLFDETDIMVLVHGAATGNLIFLPRTAIVIDLSTWAGHIAHQRAILEGLPRAWNVTFWPVDCRDCPEPIMDKLLAHEGFNALPHADQLQLLKHAAVDDANTSALVERTFGGWHQAHFLMNIRPDADEVVVEIIKATRLWYAKQQGQQQGQGKWADSAQPAGGPNRWEEGELSADEERRR